jgi:hypothetical protein
LSVLRACYDWRVLTGLAALAIAVYVLAPGLIAPVLPLLFVAACPLSMVLMMKVMTGQQASVEPPADQVSGDHAAALRHELADLARRQEQVSRELRAMEPNGQDTGEAGDAPGSGLGPLAAIDTRPRRS